MVFVIFGRLNADCLQGIPAIVTGMDFTVTIGFIAIASADRTNTFAGYAAHALHGKLKKNLLPQNLFQLEAGKLIESHLRLALVQRYFVFIDARGFKRSIKKVEGSIDFEGGTAQAAVALRLQLCFDTALNANFASGMGKQFGNPLSPKGSALGGSGIGEVDLSGLPGLRKRQLADLHLLDAQ
jgi:hypothetical protein